MGVFSATYGIYEAASTFRNVGGVSEAMDTGKKAISYQGWDQGNGKKYWLATVSTTGFKNITLSSEQNSSGSGPRDFKVQTSLDLQTWEDVPNTNLKMVVSSFDCPGATCKLVNKPLPNSNDQELLYIRWIVSADTNTKENDDGIGSSGSSRIRNIKVSGEPIPGQEIVIPTVDLAQLPADGARNVTVDAPIEIKFNKSITLEPGYTVGLVDENHHQLDSASLEVVNSDTLRVNHSSLTYGQSYTVTVPKELIKGKTDLVPLARDISWSFSVQDSPFAPKSINMTFNGDPKTSIALAWYTDVMTDTVVQVAEGQSKYSYTIEDINPAKKYDFIVKAVGTRINSDPVEVSTLQGPVESEPPSAPSELKGTVVSPYQINLKWTASAGNIQASGYNIYRNGSKVGQAEGITYSDTGLTPGTAYSYVVKAYNAEGMESLASNAIQVTTKPASTGEGVHKAYPQHTSYVAGSIKPNHLTQAELDATVGRLYNEWKAKYLKQNPYDPDQYYVWYSDGDWFEDNEITVSEAHGYGMLITSLLAGHDPEAKKYFDGLYRYFRAHPSEINPDLMAWQQADTGKEIIDINGADSATDGDMDIAYALLLADSQWGSSGEINYLSEAKKVINAIMASDVNHSEWTLKLADWVSDNDPMFGNATRPSDFMLQHLKDFKNVSGDVNWDRVADKTYSIINSLYENYSPKAGLLPDFVYKDDKAGQYKPVSQKKWDTPDGYFLEFEHDGDYNYNSSRIPWRIGTDYLLTGDARAKGQLSTLNSWIRGTTDNDPKKIVAGYKLDGTEAINDYADISFSAPLMVSAMIDSSNQKWLNQLWDYNAAVSTEDDLYFGNNLRLLSMIAVSGNWWTPTIVDTEAPVEPTIERAEAVSSSAIDLKWTPSTDNMGVTGYKIYRNDVEIKTTTATEYRDSGLSADTSYKYYVIAVDAAGNTSKITGNNTRLYRRSEH
ncbi:fibronectin type III domain-containing protein [Paenibacillus sp. JW14]|uniref:Glucanase n=2 Tax=Paenibacillus agri TaxID=2744309 RepID=A0A850EKH8_9BACL|nr:fibronectin type III domain-containing protein [Paenibacillus agri]